MERCEETRRSRETVWYDWVRLEAERSERLDWILVDKDHNVNDFLSFCIFFFLKVVKIC